MPGLSSSRWRVALLAVACLALIISFAARPEATVSPNLVISQIYGGGGNSGAQYKNDFVEIFNRGTVAISLAGKSIQYASATGTGSFGSNAITALSGTIQPGQYYLVQLAGGSTGAALPTPDATGTVNMSGTAGKVALANTTAGLACNGGSTPCSAAQLAQIIDLVGYGNANFFEGTPVPTLSNTTAAIRKGDGCAETDSNVADFSVAAPAPRNSSTPLRAVCPDVPVQTSPGGIGAAIPSNVPAGLATLLTVAVTGGTNPASTGIAVIADLTAIGGNSVQPLYNDGTHGDAAGSDTTFSFATTVPSATTTGSRTLVAKITDAEGRTGTASITVTVQAAAPTEIAIHDIQGSGTASPYADPYPGQRVNTSGIVTGVKYNGFFIQTAEADTDATTSEGLFVYTGSAPPPAATVGSKVQVVGLVQEYNGLTEIAGSPYVGMLSTGNQLPAPVTLTQANTNPAGGLEQLERYEGMRVRVNSLTAVGPTGSSGATSNGVFYGVITGVARPFREPGIEVGAPTIPGMPAAVSVFDANPERLAVDSDAIGARPIDVTTGAVITNVVGPLDYGSGSYTIDLEPAAETTISDNDRTARPLADPAPGQFTVATFNMLNFTSDATRLNKASLAIREIMRMPDIIGVEEVANKATLDALADKVNGDVGVAAPHYTAYLDLGNTTTQNVGFLVKSSVMIDSVTQVGKDVKFIDPRDGTTEYPLNDRPPLVLRASVAPRPGGEPYPLTVVVNHLRSLIDVDSDQPAGLFARTKRQLGAEYLANLIQEYQAKGEHVISVGDYNAYQFNDGYVDVIGTVLGVPAPPTQVLMPSTDLVNPDFARLDVKDAAERYSYVENGNAQALDHVLVSSNMGSRIAGLAYARIDADFPGIYSVDATRPERVSDHDPAVGYFTFPTADVSVTASAGPPDPVLSGQDVTYSLTVTNDGADPATSLRLTDTLPAGVTVSTVTAPAGWTCTTTSGVQCTAATLAARATATIAIVANIACAVASGDLESDVTVETATYDADPSNNTLTVTTSVFNPAPVISGAAAAPGVLWPVNHKFVPVGVAYTTSDNCGVPTCTLTVTSSEPTDGRGDGHTATDWQVIDPNRVMLRAERAGTANGRTYTIGIMCRDSANTTSTQNVFVTVPKSQGKR